MSDTRKIWHYQKCSKGEGSRLAVCKVLSERSLGKRKTCRGNINRKWHVSCWIRAGFFPKHLRLGSTVPVGGYGLCMTVTAYSSRYTFIFESKGNQARRFSTGGPRVVCKGPTGRVHSAQWNIKVFPPPPYYFSNLNFNFYSFIIAKTFISWVWRTRITYNIINVYCQLLT